MTVKDKARTRRPAPVARAAEDEPPAARSSPPRSSPSSSAVGAAIIGGAAVGSFLGPIGAIAGFVAGGIAGEAFERRAFRKDAGAPKGRHSTKTAMA